MSEFSKALLSTEHPGVHYQFDMLAAAMQVQIFAGSPVFQSEFKSMTQSQQDKWLKDQLQDAMIRFGHSGGFFAKRLFLLVFNLYDLFYARFISAIPPETKTNVVEVQQKLLVVAARDLDRQFARSGRADICAFLKNDPREAVGR